MSEEVEKLIAEYNAVVRVGEEKQRIRAALSDAIENERKAHRLLDEAMGIFKYASEKVYEKANKEVYEATELHAKAMQLLESIRELF